MSSEAVLISGQEPLQDPFGMADFTEIDEPARLVLDLVYIGSDSLHRGHGAGAPSFAIGSVLEK